MDLDLMLFGGLYSGFSRLNFERWVRARRAARNAPGRKAKALSLEQKVEALELGIGRVALLTRSLAELCLEKGVLTQPELLERMAKVDPSDGVADQRLDPAVGMPGEHRPADPQPIVAEPAERRRPTRRRRRLS